MIMAPPNLTGTGQGRKTAGTQISRLLEQAATETSSPPTG
jgi:hypothetical protein